MSRLHGLVWHFYAVEMQGRYGASFFKLCVVRAGCFVVVPVPCWFTPVLRTDQTCRSTHVIHLCVFEAPEYRNGTLNNVAFNFPHLPFSPHTLYTCVQASLLYKCILFPPPLLHSKTSFHSYQRGVLYSEYFIITRSYKVLLADLLLPTRGKGVKVPTKEGGRMDAPLDETSYDVIVVGTGLVQSLVAAAAARIGRRVLHLDGNGYYGDTAASLTHIELYDALIGKQPHDTKSGDCNGGSSADSRESDNSKNANATVVGDGHAMVADDEMKKKATFSKSSPAATTTTDATVVKGGEETVFEAPQGSEASPFSSVSVVITAPTNEEVATSFRASYEPSSFVATRRHSVTIQMRNNYYAPTALRALRRACSVVTRESMDKCPRKYALDIVPRIFFASGPMIQLLIESNLSRYLEFKAVQGTFMASSASSGGGGGGGGSSSSSSSSSSAFRSLPVSKEALMTDKAIGLLDKRRLVKFLQHCGTASTATNSSINNDGGAAEAKDDARIGSSDSVRATAATAATADDAEKEGGDALTFGELLEKRFRLGPDLRTFIQSGMTGLPANAPASAGIAMTKRFLASVGRYGPSPYLVSMYGGAEVAQACCRLASVYGAVYVLRRPVTNFLLTLEQKSTVEAQDTHASSGRGSHSPSTVTGDCCCVGVVAAGQRLTAPFVVVPGHLLPSPLRDALPLRKTLLARAIIIAEGPINIGGRPVAAADTISFPAGEAGNTAPVQALVLHHSLGVCAPGQVVVHLTTTLSVRHKQGREGVLGEEEEDGRRTAASDELSGAANVILGSDVKRLWTAFFVVESLAPVLDSSAQDVSAARPAHPAEEERANQSDGHSGGDCRDDTQVAVASTVLPRGLVVCSTGGGNGGHGYGSAVAEARHLFSSMCPKEEFLPAAPNPEDLIWEGDEAAAELEAEVEKLKPVTTAFGTQYYRIDAYHVTGLSAIEGADQEGLVDETAGQSLALALRPECPQLSAETAAATKTAKQ